MDGAGSADRFAKLTLALAGFMLVLLISMPFLIDSDAFTDMLPYTLYSLFLTSVGVMIGISLTWLNLEREDIEAADSIENDEGGHSALDQTGREPLLSSDERRVVDHLLSRDGAGWQAELVSELSLSASKASRILGRLEQIEVVERVRDGMGKRVILIQKQRWL